MKDKILMLVLGILIGAVITAGCFLLFSNNSSKGRPDGSMQGGNKPDMGNFVPGDMQNGGQGTQNNIATLNS